MVMAIFASCAAARKAPRTSSSPASPSRAKLQKIGGGFEGIAHHHEGLRLGVRQHDGLVPVVSAFHDETSLGDLNLQSGMAGNVPAQGIWPARLRPALATLPPSAILQRRRMEALAWME